MAVPRMWMVFICSFHLIESNNIPATFDYLPIINREKGCPGEQSKILCSSCNFMFGDLFAKCCEDAQVFKKCFLASEFGVLLGGSVTRNAVDSIGSESPTILKKEEATERNLAEEKREYDLDYEVNNDHEDATDQIKDFFPDDQMEISRGKRRGVFLGKRRKLFLGKKSFIPERIGQKSIEKRRNPFLGKRKSGKRKNPFLGKRGVIKPTEN